MNLNISKYPQLSEWESLFKRPTLNVTNLFSTVQEILDEVKSNGDQALRQYTERFDGVSVQDIQVSEQEISDSETRLSEKLKNAIRQAAANIELFHKAQRTEPLFVETMPGIRCWRKAIPIQKVGLYIPGGTAPLFSSVLMLGIPAKIAGCREIVLCSPPDKTGNINPAILFAAKIIGITTIIKAGGAQAIAAMAYGTKSVPRTDKIFGPGNQFVTAAKQLISLSGTAIDMPAGPSEVAVIADETANPAYVAADLLSQAEHGRDSQVILFTNSESLVDDIHTEIDRQLEQLPRKEMAAESLGNSRVILTKTIEEAMEMSNAYAPEHLILATKDAEELAEKVVNAGSVFVGHYTPESAGDYASGTNHTLPTNGTARAYSGVSLDSYMKMVTFQAISEEGIELLGDTIEEMAAAEQLDAHKNAVSIRRKKSYNGA
ncbi:histidinol dehydrogenase [Fulvivirga sedimenti]|uniref:Histidinol dehydrogenase n=1 Tax=Fulvivirga sedimenti TaxID=2879465 RepID=A0A9X1HQA4_9BACT|nr:histidinol dehydrogenase [Fulvivirga sedimenti]MCA6075171.1 histidinol dehydrogenase [Fulvivirga sedimenti]MCA6076348.1 histidinol dehydrogenase [Fulvivirga sedimenti]MCA6077476.1 histidinol dehydrogenase [Fulvivirga sedimenti]